MVTLPFALAGWDPSGRGSAPRSRSSWALAEECLRVGASEFTIGDGSQMPRFYWSRATTLDGSTHLLRKADRLAARYGREVRVACLEVDTPRWVDVPTGISLGRVAVSSLVQDADRVISVPVDYDRIDLHRNDSRPQDFGRLYIDLAHAAQPALTIVDFSIGIEGNGRRPGPEARPST